MVEFNEMPFLLKLFGIVIVIIFILSIFSMTIMRYAVEKRLLKIGVPLDLVLTFTTLSKQITNIFRIAFMELPMQILMMIISKEEAENIISFLIAKIFDFTNLI